MNNPYRIFCAIFLLAMSTVQALADYDLPGVKPPYDMSGQKSFKRIATLANYINNDDRGDETVSEIVASAYWGNLLVYTDSELDQLGVAYIGVPDDPIAARKDRLAG